MLFLNTTTIRQITELCWYEGENGLVGEVTLGVGKKRVHLEKMVKIRATAETLPSFILVFEAAIGCTFQKQEGTSDPEKWVRVQNEHQQPKALAEKPIVQLQLQTQ